MKPTSWRTTVAGAVAALSLGGFAGLGLPEPWPKVLGLVCAASLALLGYHSTDCQRCPGYAARLAALGTASLLVVCACGCAVHGLGFQLKVPAWGSLKLDLPGGSIGNAYATSWVPVRVEVPAAATSPPASLSNQLPAVTR